MYQEHKILAIIPARGGSKGIPNKNIIDLCGKPLIAYSIEAAKKSQYIDDVIVSTDSTIIQNISLTYGAEIPFLRPAELATDTAKTIDCMLYTIKQLALSNRHYTLVVLLQPTQPIRKPEWIDEAIIQLLNSNYNHRFRTPYSDAYNYKRRNFKVPSSYIKHCKTSGFSCCLQSKWLHIY